MKYLILLFVIFTFCNQLVYAQIKLGDDTIVSFATIDEGKKILTAQDDFVRRMSPFDRAARMRTDREVSEKEYLGFVGKNVLAWSDAQKQKITSALQSIRAKLEDMSLPFPTKVFIVRTTGKEEGGAAYTRGNAIVLPDRNLRGSVARIQNLICHELFHIISRQNPDLRDKCYAAIGFEKCDEVEFPPHLKSRKITNPDAPLNDHCILLKVEGKERWAVPIIFSRTEKYDIKRGGKFFNYLELRFLLVERNEDSAAIKPIYMDDKPKLVSMYQVSGFFEKVGKNTGYTIHPEEILADNFALLVMPTRNLRSPDIVSKLRAILKKN
jgi:hypothetical protein